MSEKLNILITGGSGCIGSESKKALLEGGLVNKIVLTSRSKKVPSSNDSDKLHYEQVDLSNTQDLLRVIQKHDINKILHTAAIRTSEAQDNPHKAFDVNVTATLNLCEAARLSKQIQRFVFISTAAVYGATTESVDETAPTTSYLPYIASKLAAEQICECYAKSYNLPTFIIRPQIIYGPTRLGEGSTAGLSHALAAAVKGQDHTIDFAGPHSFHYTDDVGKLFAISLTKDLDKNFEVYNLPGSSHTSQEFVAAITKQAQKLNLKLGEMEAGTKEMPFPAVLNHQKFYQDFPEVKIKDLDTTIELGLKYFL